MDALIESARGLRGIPREAAAAYEEAKDRLIEQVNRVMADQPEIQALIGHNPLVVMYDNHRNHARFMANVFGFSNFELLARTLPWVYRSYHARGFSFDYFPVALEAWIGAVRNHLDPSAADAIVPVYRWILGSHAELQRLSLQQPLPPPTAGGVHQEVKEELLSSLLRGDHQACIRTAMSLVQGPGDLGGLYLGALQPALYEIGSLWERGEISVAQEHLATAIVGRVMAALYPRVLVAAPTRGRAVVTSAPNELHEVGGRMVADLLEVDGWDVHFLGANTPQGDLLRMLDARDPFLLALSVAMPFNVRDAAELVGAVRENPRFNGLKILIGGRSFNEIPELWKSTSADGWAPDGAGAVDLARGWWEEREGR